MKEMTPREIERYRAETAAPVVRAAKASSEARKLAANVAVLEEMKRAKDELKRRNRKGTK